MDLEEQIPVGSLSKGFPGGVTVEGYCAHRGRGVLHSPLTMASEGAGPTLKPGQSDVGNPVEAGGDPRPSHDLPPLPPMRSVAGAASDEAAAPAHGSEAATGRGGVAQALQRLKGAPSAAQQRAAWGSLFSRNARNSSSQCPQCHLAATIGRDDAAIDRPSKQVEEEAFAARRRRKEAAHVPLGTAWPAVDWRRHQHLPGVATE